MMRDFIDAYPAAGINLVSSISRLLLTQFEEGRLDVMLTTEPISTGQGECLYRGPLGWYAGRGSSVYDQRPLPLAAKSGCIFLPVATRALEQADIAWSLPYEATDWRDLTAFVSAGLAVETNMPYVEDIKDWERVPDSAGLPPLPDFGVFLYVSERASPLALQLAGIIRDVDFAPKPRARSRNGT